MVDTSELADAQLRLEQVGHIETNEPGSWTDLNLLVRLSRNGREHGLTLRTYSDGSLTDKFLFPGEKPTKTMPPCINPDALSDRILGKKSYLGSQWLFFHSHPPSATLEQFFSVGPNNEVIELVPSFQSNSFWQELGGDIASMRSLKNRGGTVNIVADAGYTFCINRSLMDADIHKNYDYKFNRLRQTPDVYCKVNILQGHKAGTSFTSKEGYAAETSQLLGPDGIAVFQLEQPSPGIIYTFLSLSPDRSTQLLQAVSLHDIAFGSALPEMSKMFGVKELVRHDNLHQVIIEQIGYNYTS